MEYCTLGEKKKVTMTLGESGKEHDTTQKLSNSMCY